MRKILLLVISFLLIGANMEAQNQNQRILIAYFSWGGNTRGIAQQIHQRVGGNIFEITTVTPYSSDYNTVLQEAQREQQAQARPPLRSTVANMAQYDVIILGYPIWYSTIPMPIATFLEEYDFSGKTIIPFCSHGGGSFSRSLTDIARLVPNARLGEVLAVRGSGGSSLPNDIAAWLRRNGVTE